MRATSIIFRREMAAYLRSPVGWIIAFAALLVEGALFQAWGLSRPQLSGDVVAWFFNSMSIVTSITAVVLAIRLVSEERQSHSIVLLNTAPIGDTAIVAGKFLAALTFLAGILALSVYMPLLIKVNGKISGAEILVGYLGLFLIGAAYLAIGLFASSLTRYALVAAVVALGIGGLLALLFQLSKVLDWPFDEVMSRLDVWWGHFHQGFEIGVLSAENVLYYLGLTYFFLFLAVKTMEAKRWQ